MIAIPKRSSKVADALRSLSGDSLSATHCNPEIASKMSAPIASWPYLAARVAEPIASERIVAIKLVIIDVAAVVRPSLPVPVGGISPLSCTLSISVRSSLRHWVR